MITTRAGATWWPDHATATPQKGNLTQHLTRIYLFFVRKTVSYFVLGGNKTFKDIFSCSLIHRNGDRLTVSSAVSKMWSLQKYLLWCCDTPSYSKRRRSCLTHRLDFITCLVNVFQLTLILLSLSALAFYSVWRLKCSSTTCAGSSLIHCETSFQKVAVLGGENTGFIWTEDDNRRLISRFCQTD